MSRSTTGLETGPVSLEAPDGQRAPDENLSLGLVGAAGGEDQTPPNSPCRSSSKDLSSPQHAKCVLAAGAWHLLFPPPEELLPEGQACPVLLLHPCICAQRQLPGEALPD